MLNKDRALVLLGDGIPPEQVAAALGVTPSAISQLLAQDEFKEEVLERKYQNLAAHNARDSKADTIEDTLLEKLQDSLSMLYKPMEIVKAYSVLNAAKRRGSSAPASITNQNQVINLTLPKVIIHNFQVNQVNQVTSVDSQDLNTIQSSTLLSNLKEGASHALIGTATKEGKAS